MRPDDSLPPLTEGEAANIKALFADATYGLVCQVLLHKWGTADDFLAGLDPRQTDRALGRRDIALGLRYAVTLPTPALITLGLVMPAAPSAPPAAPKARRRPA